MSAHSDNADTKKQLELEKAIAKEMFPFLFFAILPVSLIAAIAFTFGPSY